jgi:hypothetical protein
MNTNPEPDSRSPSNEEKDSHPLPQKLVFLAVRVVTRRLLGSRLEERFEAELRELIGDVYVTVGRVARTSRDLAKCAARALAHQRGWIVSSKRFGWTTRNVLSESTNAEDDNVEVPPEPCVNEDCDKCYPLPRFVVSADRVVRRRRVRTIKAATAAEARRIYDAGTAWPSAYDDLELEVLEQGDTVIVITEEHGNRRAENPCYHEASSSPKEIK